MAVRGLNKVMLIGHLGADPEMRYTPNGRAVTTFRIAVSRTWKDPSTGEQQQDTQWVRIVTWAQLAETCARYLTKGRQVYVEGRLQTRTWDTPDGSRRSITEVVAQDVILLGPPAAVPEVEERPEAARAEAELPFIDEIGMYGEEPSEEPLPF
ncbi:MAG: single-stranded DNA-binding protein [Chloroflexia bacterium]